METNPAIDAGPDTYPSIQDLANAHPDIVAGLTALDPISAAANFGALLACGALQANTLRLEILVHLALSYGMAQALPSPEFLQQAFAGLGDGWCGLMEDPAEDVFASLASTSVGNFRVLEGIREGGGFYLQRMLDVIEAMPRAGSYDRIRSSVFALLALSDAVLKRAGVGEFELGEELPRESIPEEFLNALGNGSSVVAFSEEQLAGHGIARVSLAAFEFDVNNGLQLREDAVFHTALERRPLACRGGTLFLLLPTAVGTAISRFVAEEVWASGQTPMLSAAIAREFARLFVNCPLLGLTPRRTFQFEELASGAAASALTEVDAGRFFQFVFFTDGLEDFLDSGFNGVWDGSQEMTAALEHYVRTAYSEAQRSQDFKAGITLVVGCGIGRAMAMPMMGDLPDNWQIQSVSANDLYTLSWIQGFDTLSLFRLAEAQQAVEREGIVLFNPHGLLNLVAWARKMKGHLVPHSQLPSEFAQTDGPRFITIEQNALRSVRFEVMKDWQPRRALDGDSKWVALLKPDPSFFAEDNRAPLFASPADISRGRARSVYLGKRPYWIEVKFSTGTSRDSAYEHWMMLNAWLRRIGRVFDDRLSLPERPLTFLVTFAAVYGDTKGLRSAATEAELRSLIRVVANTENDVVTIDVGLASTMACSARRTLLSACWWRRSWLARLN